LEAELPIAELVLPLLPLEHRLLGECGAIGLVLYETATAPAWPPRADCFPSIPRVFEPFREESSPDWPDSNSVIPFLPNSSISLFEEGVRNG
ncbi:unnamed protein product, partial [Heterotrigona itama]